MPEQAMTCPRRMTEMGPWQYQENLDFWNGMRYPALPDGSRVRTCSFCGGAHPEDVIRLLEAGWEDERTDKPYKGYLHPPGTKLHDHRTFHRGEKVPRPPLLDTMFGQVKFYAPHFEQAGLLEKLNSLSTACRVRLAKEIVDLPKLLGGDIPVTPFPFHDRDELDRGR